MALVKQNILLIAKKKREKFVCDETRVFTNICSSAHEHMFPPPKNIGS